MFGECVDFAPAPARGRGKQKPLLPPSQVAHVVQLTPQEQANQLANTVGLDPTLMKGCPAELLHGINAADLRVAVRYAVNQVQEGRVDTEKIDEYLSDFLSKRIALMPLATRFPLLAEWSSKGGDDKIPLTLKSKDAKPIGPSQSSASNFISFDSLPGGSYPREHTSSGMSSLQPQPKPQKPEKVQEKKTRKRDVPVEVQEEDVSWQRSVELGPSQVRNVKVARAFLETIQNDSEALEKDRAVRREQEAKNTASKVMVSFEQTKAAVEAGLLAAKKSQQLLRGDAEKKSHAESVAAAFATHHGSTLVEKESDLAEQGISKPSEADKSQGVEGAVRRVRVRRRRKEEVNGESLRDADFQDNGGRRIHGRGYDDYGVRRRHRDDSRERPHDDDYDRGGRFHFRSDHGERQQGRVHQDNADLRSRSRSCEDRHAQRRFRDAEGDAQISSDRRRLSRSTRSRSRDDDVSRSRLSDTLDRKANEARKNIASGPFNPAPSGKLIPAATSGAIVKSGAPDGKISAPGAFSTPAAKPEPRLRILACKGTWAEYVDQDTGEHVFKNVLTNEMTKKKPAEFGDVISDSMNQRRLSWLAGQRNAAMMGDLQQMQQMQQRPQGFM